MERTPTIRKIAQIGHPILRRVADPVPISEIRSAPIQELIDDMIATMRDAMGAGLAAPQVHESVQICVLEVRANARYPYAPDIPLTVLINPVLAPLTAEIFGNYEGCLSVPNLRGLVERFAEIRVMGFDRDGQPVDRVARGISAGTYQHEVDHLNATLFLDRVKDPRSLTTLAEFDRYHREAYFPKARAVVDRFGG
ncbi:MAG: peptide deformylase [Deltaproteobacteria bacterium]|nr:peptide deformylase [Deltaproteobacteria bacterium]